MTADETPEETTARRNKLWRFEIKVGFDFDALRSEFSNDTFDVIGYIDDERLLEMISLVIEGKEPFYNWRIKNI